MRFDPHDYQRRAIGWIKDHPRCALFLDMGLGKTVSTLTAVVDLIDDCEVNKVLVVAPKKVAESTWSTEAQKWDHLRGLRISKVMGTAKQRVEALEAKADVYVIGRDSFVWLFGHYNGKLPFDMVVLDELTSFKSNTSQRFKAMRKVTPTLRRVVGLTGTPAPNGLLDLWAQIYCIDGGERLGKFYGKYREVYFDQYVINNIPIRCTIKRGAEQIIRNKIADICLTMEAKDYLTLPPVMYVDRPVQLSEKLQRSYSEFEREKVLETVGDDSVISAPNAAALMNKLSQYANGAVYDDDHQVHEIHQEKIETLLDIIEFADSAVLVFYQYKHDVDRIAAAIKGKRVRVYKGADDLDDWNAGGIDVLLAHPASTAYGLNMQQGGHTVVWFGTGWNLELYQQANARLHRQGQEHPVTVIKLITAGTVDERAAAAIESKKSTQQGLIDSLKALQEIYCKNA